MADEDVQDMSVADVSVDTAPASDTSYSNQSYDAAPAQQTYSPYEAFRSLPDFQGQDDLSIAQNLYRAHTGFQETQRQLNQYQSLLPKTQEYLTNEREYLAWKQAQAEASRPKPAETPKWWNPPAVKDTWKSYIVRDPSTGKEIISPEAPFEAQQSLREYQAYTADFARRFVTDPENTLKPFIEQIAQQKAQELVQGQLGQYTEQNYVKDLEQQNADWLYTAPGQISQEGAAIQHYIREAAENGVNGSQARWKYATSMLHRDLLQARYQQGMQQQAPPQYYNQAQYASAPPAPPSVEAQNMQFLRERATRTANRSAGTTEPQAPRGRQSFQDRLLGQLKNDGVL